ncbi:hypothetical protein [Kineothrix sedimenti]|uniref:Uncharacterized protein n=1 Tax=Kineothrix sedimenti TaxID=3123317 RepID=A0ABZ3EZT0_9FIRM
MEVLLIREEDVQVLHDFDSMKNTLTYLSSSMLQDNVFLRLKPLWNGEPDVKIYNVA